MKLIAAPDKFKGTMTASEAAEAIAKAARTCSWEVVKVPLSDGGDGFLDVFGGANRESTVTGALGDSVVAPWSLRSGTAVIESAAVCGLVGAGGPEGNDPVGATTSGVGELIAEAVSQGATRVMIGLGGSATTDGGLGAVQACVGVDLSGVEIIGSCDVSTLFEDAAVVFAPQKGATASEIPALTARLGAIAERYRSEYGLDVSKIAGSGAAGGLGGGLLALGGQLVPGFEIVSGEVGLEAKIADADLIITGEGQLDDESFNGKVVGGLLEAAERHGVPVVVIAGACAPGVEDRVSVVSLSERFGSANALSDSAYCVERAGVEILSSALDGPLRST